jgi:hypothetical protein
MSAMTRYRTWPSAAKTGSLSKVPALNTPATHGSLNWARYGPGPIYPPRAG